MSAAAEERAEPPLRSFPLTEIPADPQASHHTALKAALDNIAIRKDDQRGQRFRPSRNHRR